MFSNFTNLIDFNDMSFDEWEELCELASEIYGNPKNFGDCCKGNVLATLFYEPSTRTKFSFQTAMYRLGGNVIGFSGTAASSVAKGENLRDTVRIVANYADAVVIRHLDEGAAFAASLYSNIPVINAGDGSHLHPTQTMTDLFTIKQLKGTMKNLSIGVCGDLLYGRTVHSLMKALSLYSDNTFYLISTPELAVPKHFVHELAKNNRIVECNTIEECINKLDILYMTRIQKERFKSAEEYEKQRGVYILDHEKLKDAQKDLAILHPLPKNDEITADVDDDIRAKYFKQAELGLYIRMALLIKLLENAERNVRKNQTLPITESGIKCKNHKCITNSEIYLPNIKTVVNNTNNIEVCSYCESFL